MAELRDVKHICLDWRGIVHVVDAENNGWVHTLCDTLGPGESQTTWPLKPRVCRQCRKRLKHAVLKVMGE